MKAFLKCVFWLMIGVSASYAQSFGREVRIGVLGLFHAKQIVITAWHNSPLQCRGGTEVWPVREPMLVKLEGTKLKLTGKDSNFSGTVTCDNGIGSTTEFSVNVPGKISRRYLGKLEVAAGAGELRVVVAIELETAVASIVAAESPAHAPLEALKAQAVATRSFLLAGKGRHHGFDFCDTTHCQFLREPPMAQTAAFQAAAATQGLVLAYKDEVFAAMYSRSCSGHTHSLDELGIPVHGYPYFAVSCNYCQRHPEKWVAQIRSEDAANLSPTESSRLQLARKLGWKTVPSNSYASRKENGTVVLEGIGVGHGIGLCQRGSADMARHGATFQQILEHYYPNTEVKQN